MPSQSFVTVRNNILLQVTQHFHNNFSLRSNLQTSQHRQPRTIQIVRARTSDLTMAAAGQAFGLARAAPGITCGRGGANGCLDTDGKND